MADYVKPIPVLDSSTKIFWQGCSNQELLIQKCISCNRFQFYPRHLCINCLSENLEWIKSSGKGVIHTFTIVHQNIMPGFSKELPYIYAVIEIKEGVRLTTNIVGCNPDKVYIGMPVTVCYEKIGPELSLPKFVPVTGN